MATVAGAACKGKREWGIGCWMVNMADPNRCPTMWALLH